MALKRFFSFDGTWPQMKKIGWLNGKLLLLSCLKKNKGEYGDKTPGKVLLEES